MEAALQHNPTTQLTEIQTTSAGNDSVPDPEIAGFRGCDSLTLKLDLIRGAGQPLRKTYCLKAYRRGGLYATINIFYSVKSDDNNLLCHLCLVSIRELKQVKFSEIW